MKIIIKGKGEGKTTDLIRMSHELFYYIICHSRDEASRIFIKAQSMGLDIPHPLTFDEFIIGEFYAKGIRGFLIDNVELLLAHLARGVEIGAITITTGE